MSHLSQLIDTARNTYNGKCELHFIHPALYLVCRDQSFDKLDEEARREKFLQQTKLTAEVLEEQSLNTNLLLYLVTDAERESDLKFLDDSSPGFHWLPFFDKQLLISEPRREGPLPRAVHFYGYKGGQARSTVLAMLAQQLANDGHRVLVVDADLEAPSLDILFSVGATNADATLLGISHPSSEVHTLAAFTPGEGEGRVDLIACRPTSSEYDMDFAAFVLRCTLDAVVLQEAINKLREFVNKMSEDERYDFILFDHRSGLASSVLPVMMAYPGPTVVCLRLDDQSSGASALFDIMLGRTADFPGAFVSFSLDPEETSEKINSKRSERIESLLDQLGKAMERGLSDIPEDATLSPDELKRFWIPWFHDRAFLSTAFPPIDKVSHDNTASLSQLREVLGLSGRRVSKDRVAISSGGVHLDPSGARDEGIFIEPEGIRLLLQPNTNIRYIFGRKGTGKTRLVHELTRRKVGDKSLGEPLILSGDEQTAGGLPIGVLFKDLADIYASRRELLWWVILYGALKVSDTAAQAVIFNEILESIRKAPNSIVRSDVAKLAAEQTFHRVFLIDGLETAFAPDNLLGYISSLFDFLATIQNDQSFTNRVTIRLFLRTDLYKRSGGQNTEQLTAKRRLDLAWDAQSIFNFVLSRISRLEWFLTNFPDVCNEINQQQDQIRRGQLTADVYERLLLLIFPERLRRNNLQTLTFLNTYFSDAAGDDDSRAAFYPRLFDAFLQRLVEGNPSADEALEHGRIHQRRILDAHEKASADFLTEVRQELHLLLDMSPKPDVNRTLVDNLVGAFTGLQTPFNLDACLRELNARLSSMPQSTGSASAFTSERLREAMQHMKEIGMFEDRPGYPGEWRVGRLFKTALKMKYVRG